MKTRILSIITFLTLYLGVNAQNVYIPDVNFKSYLVGNTAINANGDTEISFTEAAAVTGTINVSNKNILDLTGIEAFTSVTKLNIQNNQIINLDVSNNTALRTLTCQNNQIASLDLLSNTALTYLNYSNNQIVNLNISNNTALEYLFCNNNQINNLDLSSNTALVKLSCTNNLLIDLDVSANTALADLNCSINQLTTLALSVNTALTKLYCVGNQITSLDLSAQILLESLFCENNQLTSLNVANGNNSNFLNFNSTVNPDLICIQVDNVAYSNTNWATNKDAAAVFSTNCANLIVHTLTIPTYTGGTLTISPSSVNGKYADGTVVTLTATPATGYLFNFFNFPGASMGSNTTNPLTITMDGDKTILPVFNNIIRTLQLSTTNNGSQNDGTVKLTEGTNSTNYFTGGTFNDGTSITLTATPRTANHQFDGWSGGVTSTANPITFTMDSDKNILANFSIIQHSLTINATNGTVTRNINPTNGTYDNGTVVGLTAVPDAGYQFDGWSGDVTGTSTFKNVYMYADKTVTATFSLISTNDTEWLGVTSDWDTASNWTNGVPNATTNAIIPNTSIAPIINNTQLAIVKDLELQSGASLTVEQKLTIEGNLVLNGFLTVKSTDLLNGSLILKGTLSGSSEIIYDRYVTDAWYLLSAPVLNKSISEVGVSAARNGEKYAIAPYDNTQASSLDKYAYYTTAAGTPTSLILLFRTGALNKYQASVTYLS